MKLSSRWLAVYVLLVPVFSFAEEEAPSVVSEASQGEQEAGWASSVALEYSNSFIGPSLSSPISDTGYDDVAEDHRGPLGIENSISLGYRFNEDLVLGPVTRWNWFMGKHSAESFELMDPYLKLSHGKLYSNANLNIAADLRLSAPLSDESRQNGLMTSLASEQELTYEIPSSRFSLGLTTFVQFNFHRETNHQDGDFWELHFAPEVAFKVSDSVVVNAVYEATKTQARFSDLSAQQPEGSLFELGLTWDILENLSFNPNLHTKTSRPLALESMTVGFKLEWALL